VGWLDVCVDGGLPVEERRREEEKNGEQRLGSFFDYSYCLIMYGMACVWGERQTTAKLGGRVEDQRDARAKLVNREEEE
jgi:hypothetical protein